MPRGRRLRRQREQRARALAEWHGALIDRLVDTDAEDRLGRLTGHPALGGPERTFRQARLAAHRGDPGSARRLVEDCLRSVPGHTGFLDFAASIQEPLSPGAPQQPERPSRRTEPVVDRAAPPPRIVGTYEAPFQTRT